jgi:hypothetical protein
MTEVLKVSNLVKTVRRPHRHRQPLARSAPGRDPCRDRAERRRQDHDDRPADRRAASRCRHDSFHGPGHHRDASASAVGQRYRALVPDHLDFSRTSPRWIMSRWPCRRMTAIPSASGAAARKDKSLREPALQALEQVGLAHRADVTASALSHGEHRQLEIAMALATKPKLLLLDEPMAGMGPEDSARMVRMLQGIKGSVTILLIDTRHGCRFPPWPTALQFLSMAMPSRPVCPTTFAATHRCGRRTWVMKRRRSESYDRSSDRRRHRHLLRPQPGSVRHVAHHQGRRSGHADGPQRHGQRPPRSARSWA